MEALGIPRGSYVVKVNNRKVLDGVLESIGLGGEASAGKRLAVLRAIDKYDRLGNEGIRQLLGAGRKDESGDFTRGAELSDEQNLQIRTYLTTAYREGSPELSEKGRSRGETSPILNFPGEETWPSEQMSFRAWGRNVNDSQTGIQGVAELEEMARLCRAAGYGPGRIMFESSVVRGLEYYTGPIFEVELTFPIEDEDGKPIRFGSVGGGGRYDGLIERFRGEPVPATGFSIGVSRLLAALQHLGKIDSKPEPGPVVVTVFADIPIAHYQRLVAQLREAEYAPGKTIRAELYLGDGKFGAQMKYADKRGSPCVVIQGGNEKAKGEVQIKDLILGAEIAGMSKDRDDYLKKQATAQFAVAEDKLVDAVREVLARHDVNWS